MYIHIPFTLAQLTQDISSIRTAEANHRRALRNIAKHAQKIEELKKEKDSPKG